LAPKLCPCRPVSEDEDSGRHPVETNRLNVWNGNHYNLSSCLIFSIKKKVFLTHSNSAKISQQSDRRKKYSEV
jgi:hypothetical protein